MSGAEAARFDSTGATTETAFVLGELYRRQGAWKFRAVGQGYATGLAGLATEFGILVDDPGTGQTQHQPAAVNGELIVRRDGTFIRPPSGHPGGGVREIARMYNWGFEFKATRGKG
ncbi:TerD family protein [Nocardia sp. NPDC051990]|uniref:TerD family protein n=1 Tax=Nocardia sp. NPDC051990 TaxID=3155285 RepID=UPI0034339C04